jgi:anti-anti-sigma regulatory factor
MSLISFSRSAILGAMGLDALKGARTATKKAKQKIQISEIITEVNRLQEIVGIENVDSRFADDAVNPEQPPLKYWPFESK